MASISDQEKSLLYLFEKPSLPVEVPKGNGGFMFRIPGTKFEIGPRIGGAGATVVDVRTSPAADSMPRSVSAIRRGQPFSLFFPHHRIAARELCQIFMNAKSPEELRDVAVNCKNRVNEALFVYALSYTIINKRELRGMRVPPLSEIFPARFLPSVALEKARKEASLINMQNTDVESVTVEHRQDFSGTDLNLEHRLAYWREDYGINSHHWHWHLIFPVDFEVNRDRKGELFYYMHSQMLARYDTERLCVGLRRTLPLENWRAPISEGYFPKISNASNAPWGSRQDNTVLSDYRRLENVPDSLEPFTLTLLELWRGRIMDAIHNGYIIDRQGNRITLSDQTDITKGQKRGIDIIGDSLESDRFLSPNHPYYGDLHNLGHILIAFAHDPDGYHKEAIGVMGESGTAMRDPVFYRWHKFVDEVFQEYKLLQDPYTEQELSMPGVRVTSIGVTTGRDANVLFTGWTMRDIEASRGLDFLSTIPVMVRLTHLDNRPFQYHILIDSAKPQVATIRIFLAPKLNESGQEMTYMDQRLLWLEMDKFTFNLRPGSNRIVRNSSDSSITIPEELTFRQLETGSRDPGTAATDYCGCGWPQHMLVPRGTPGGMVFQLLVMATDWNEDKVDSDGRRTCANAASFCGVLDGKYPDRRPMGFPFDRRQPMWLQSEDQLVVRTSDLTRLDNIAMQDIRINFLSQELK